MPLDLNENKKKTMDAVFMLTNEWELRFRQEMPYEKKNRANNGLEKHSQHVLFSLLLITVLQ